MLDDFSRFVGEEIEGRYVLCEVLGEGSYGVVFSAEERAFGEAVGSVALKLMRPKGAAEREAVVREVRAMAGLSHPNLVAYRSSGEVGSGPLKGCLYLATELAEGSLADELLLKGKLPEEEVRALARDLASALEYLHSQQAVHRDVKPENVLRCGTVWKLGDFGLVRAFAGTQVSASGMKGTALYMSPEAVESQTGPHVDIWALGVVLQQAASGTLAYTGGSKAELIAGLLAKEPTIAAGLPGWLEALVRACLDKERSKRPVAKDVLECATVASPPSKGRFAKDGRGRLSKEDILTGYELGRQLTSGRTIPRDALKRLRALDFREATDSLLSNLRISTRLQSLSIAGSRVTDAGLTPIRGLSELKYVHFSNCYSITDCGIRNFESLLDLEFVCFFQTPLTDAGLSHLRNLTKLENLWLQWTAVRGLGLAGLTKLTELRWLSLTHSPVNDASLAYVHQFTKLMTIELGETEVTDAGLAILKDLVSLQEIVLLGTGVTDEGILHLENLHNLTYVDLHRTRVTAQGVQRLSTVLPHCQVRI